MNGVNGESVAGKALRGSVLNIGSSIITSLSGFLRSVLLARLLLPEDFGVVALALFFISLAMQVQRFGLGKAYILRDGDSSASRETFASLHMGLTAVAACLALMATPILVRLYPEQPQLVPILIVLVLFEALDAFNSVAATILAKDLRFRRVAVLGVASSLSMTVIAPLAALAGAGVWALVVERVIGTVIRAIGLWVVKRPWRPRFRIDRSLARWYLKFGSILFANDVQGFFLDRFDDFWTGTFLGTTALGFYSRAYDFARYPRRMLSGPLVKVFLPTFASLQNDRLRLSKAFYRVSSVIVRIGFLVFGTFALVAPEFIRIFLGDKWMPMAFAFRLMMVYALFDPLTSICGNLLAVVGQPQIVTKIQPVRLVLFVPAVIFLGIRFGINGVAVAADIMLGVGVALLLWQARRFVDFSVWRIFLVPSLAIGLGALVTISVEHLFLLPAGDWWRLVVKVIIAALVYSATSSLLEREQYTRAFRLGWQLLSTKALPSVISQGSDSASP